MASAEIIGVGFAAFLVTILLLKKYGIISFKYAEEKEAARHTCPVHEQAMAVLARGQGAAKRGRSGMGSKPLD